MIKHILIFKFKPEVVEKEKDICIEMLRSLKNKIPEIQEWEIGKQRQELDGYYDFVQVSSFENIEAMNRFRGNLEHEKVRNYLKERADWVKVDYDI